MFFDENAGAGDWRAQKHYCEEQAIALHRNIAFALARTWGLTVSAQTPGDPCLCFAPCFATRPASGSQGPSVKETSKTER